MLRTVILLPTYNERENIQKIVPLLFSALPEVRIMAVDDNSPDGTAAVVKDLQRTYPNLLLFERAKKEGLGRAYTDAFKKVLTDFPEVDVVVTMDADLSHDHEKLPAMLAKAEAYDLVIGSRYVPGGRLEGWEFHRRMLSRLGNRYVRLVTKLPVRDATSGFNCIRTSALKKLNFSALDPSGYAFLIALKYTLWKQGARIAEAPITFRSRLSGESKISMRIIEEGLLLPWKLIQKERSVLVKCPICMATAGRYWFTKNNCHVHRCSACGLIFVHPTPDPATIYSEEYFCGAHGGFGYINYDEEKGTDTKSFTAYLDRIERLHSVKGALLDVGAATGAFVAAAKARGWDASGVEISDFAAGIGRKKGLSVQTGTLDSVTFAPESFDVVTLWDVFEHVPDPHRALEQIRTILKPGGLAVMNLPDAGSLYARMAGKCWPLIIPPEHMHLFREENLKNLLEAHGFAWLEKDKIGKSYTPAYVLQILSTIRGNPFWKRVSDRVRNTPLNKASLPIHLRDNMFVIARKR